MSESPEEPFTREREIKTLVESKYEVAVQDFFEELDSAIRKGRLTEDEAISALYGMGTDLGDNYKDWIDQ